MINKFSMISERRVEVCEVHGSYESVLICSTWFGCEDCEAVEQAEKSASAHAKEAEKEKRWAYSRLRASGIPKRFCNSTIDGYNISNRDQAAIRQSVRIYADDLIQGKYYNALLLGNVGTGKTHLGCALLNEMGQIPGRHVRYASLPMLMDRIKSAFSPKSEENKSEIIYKHVKCDLLMIDEAGVQGLSDFEREVLYSIIDGRYIEEKPTIIASNLNLEQLTLFLGDRIVDRLRDNGSKVLPFTWKSERG